MIRLIKLAAMTILVSLATTGTSSATPIYERTELFANTIAFTDTFTVVVADNYTATLVDFEFTVPLDTVAMSIISSTAGLLGSLLAPGSFTFDATPGMYDINVFAAAGSTSTNVGFFGISIEQTTVPEPAALALFGLGLAGLGWSRRKIG